MLEPQNVAEDVANTKIQVGRAGDHTPSRICIHVGAEVEGVLGVNQFQRNSDLYCAGESGCFFIHCGSVDLNQLFLKCGCDWRVIAHLRGDAQIAALNRLKFF